MQINIHELLDQQACDSLLNAIRLYQRERFEEAHIAARDYITEYGAKARREAQKSNIKKSRNVFSFIVVTTKNTDPRKFLKCILSILNQNCSDLDLIIVLNGCEIDYLLLSYLCQQKHRHHSLKIYKIPENIYPSEARNLGAHAASGDWIIFIDDDGFININYTNSIERLIHNGNLLGCRGKVIPINKTLTPPGHYDLGETEKICELNIEGNLLINKNLFLIIGGFNPLMYAHEGRNLHARCMKIVDSSNFKYIPSLVLSHDPSQGSKLDAKIMRNELANSYLMMTNLVGAPHASKIDVKVVITGESSKKYLASILHDLAFKEVSPFKFDILVLANDVADSLKIAAIYRPLLNIKVLKSPQTAIEYIKQKDSTVIIVLGNAKVFTYSAFRVILPDILQNKISILKSPSMSQIGLCAYISSAVDPETNLKLNNIKTYILNKAEEFKSKKKLFKRNILLASFYTPDPYYTQKATELSERLDALGIDFCIKKIEIPKGLSWPDICRKKVKYIHDAYIKFKDEYRKVGWIDVDCSLDRLPDFLVDFEVDIIGFARGFQNSQHKRKQLTRFWEPCFFVFNTNSRCDKFISTAANIESESEDIKATDDYFFEESWRKHKNELTYFCIPGEYSNRFADKNLLKSQYRAEGIFFEFGESGKVREFKGKVKQHQVDETKNIPSEIEDKGIKHRNNAFQDLLKIIDSDKGAIMKPEKTILNGINELVRDQVKSLVSYGGQNNYIPLFWWIRPSPGNMGDWLSPYIVSKILGLSVEYNNRKDAKIISLGSIGRYIESHHTVWGTGISTTQTDLDPNANYLAVRGPYTSRALLQSGGPRVEVFGDPGILLRMIYKPRKLIKNSFVYGFVRHYIHQDVPLTFDDGIEDLNILLSSSNAIENFISRLVSYKAVLTTSLHVIILCHAYRIPCRLVNLNSEIRQVHGDGIKYKDFYEGADLRYLPHANLGDHIYVKDFDSLVSDEFASEAYGEELTKVLITELRNNPSAFICKKTNSLL